MILSAYLLIGALTVWLISIPHRRDGVPYVPPWAWVAAATLWPLTLTTVLVMAVRVAIDKSREG